MELHRSVTTALQMLNQHHSLLVGALMGCDAATQQSMLDEHRSRVSAALEALARLGNFLDHCRVDAISDGTVHDTTTDADGVATV